MSRETQNQPANNRLNFYFNITLLLLSMGLGGITVLLPEYYDVGLPIAYQFVVVFFSTASALALSLFIIRALEASKKRGEDLLGSISAFPEQDRLDLERQLGSGADARYLVRFGQISSGTAVAMNLSVLIATLLRLINSDPRWLPKFLVMTSSTTTSASNLTGFILSMLLAGRIDQLIEKLHLVELRAQGGQEENTEVAGVSGLEARPLVLSGIGSGAGAIPEAAAARSAQSSRARSVSGLRAEEGGLAVLSDEPSPEITDRAGLFRLPRSGSPAQRVAEPVEASSVPPAVGHAALVTTEGATSASLGPS